MSFSVEVQWNLSVCCSYRLQEEAELSEHLVRCIKRFSSAAKLEASAHASNVLCLQMVTACYNTDAETVREDCGPAKFWTTQQALMSVFGSFCTIVFFLFFLFTSKWWTQTFKTFVLLREVYVSLSAKVLHYVHWLLGSCVYLLLDAEHVECCGYTGCVLLKTDHRTLPL